MNSPISIIENVERDAENAAEFCVGGLTARAIIEALNRAGYVIVPKEPTRVMLDAAYSVTKITGDTPKGVLSPRNKMRARYAAMLNAAPGA